MLIRQSGVAVFCAALLVIMTASPALADARSEAQKQVAFGIKVAQDNLWREAIARFKNATALDPSYAEAWNDLAIAYEQDGDLGSARDAYERALKLDPKNEYIKQNAELFREIAERANRQK